MRTLKIVVGVAVAFIILPFVFLAMGVVALVGLYDSRVFWFLPKA